MSNPAQARRCPDVPHNAWYVAGAADEIGRSPVSRRMLGTAIALYRTATGQAVALEDRCAHRPVPLSTGHVEGDVLVAGYTGFRYGPDGVCVGVPTQEQVPFGTAVRAYPVHEDDTFVWVWMGDPRLARLRPPPETSWLGDLGWPSFGRAWETRAGIRLLLDNFSDITHVAHVDPAIAPPALGTGPTPPLNVTVSETTMSFSREYAPAPLAGWHSQLLGVPVESTHPQREEGEFCSPGLWVDRWHVQVGGGEVRSFLFTHALTPIDETTTRHVWRVSRNFAPGPAAAGTLLPLFEGYYRKVQGALETMQQIVTDDGPRAEVSVAADAAATQVRKIMDRLVADETGSR